MGKPLITLVLYKLLCDFEGKIRKRSLVQCEEIKSCEILTKSSAIIRDNIKDNFTKEYKKFLNYKIKMPVSNVVTSLINVPEEYVKEIEVFINECFDTPFTYADLLEKIGEHFTMIDLDIYSLHRSFSRTKNNLQLILFNDDYLVDGRRAVFYSCTN